MSYRRLISNGLRNARIDSLVGSAPLPPGMSGEKAQAPAPRAGLLAALRRRSRDDVVRRPAA